MGGLSKEEGLKEALRMRDGLLNSDVKRIGITPEFDLVIEGGSEFDIPKAAILGWIVKHFEINHHELEVQLVTREKKSKEEVKKAIFSGKIQQELYQRLKKKGKLTMEEIYAVYPKKDHAKQFITQLLWNKIATPGKLGEILYVEEN